MIYSVRPSWLTRMVYPSAIWRIKGTQKKIYLTFDDGPVPGVTPQVLSILKNYNAKATFFCVGQNISKHPDIFSRLIAEGHTIGNHTYNHLDGWKTRSKVYTENISQCDFVIRHSSFVIRHSPLFRPPYGRMRPSQYLQLSQRFSIVMWDVLSGDFDSSTAPEKCLRQTIAATRSGSIVGFHDSVKAEKNLLYALPRFLEHFSERGFVFERLQ